MKNTLFSFFLLLPLILLSCAEIEEPAHISLVFPREVTTELLKSAASRAASSDSGALTIECTVSGKRISKTQSETVLPDSDIPFVFSSIPTGETVTVKAVVRDAAGAVHAHGTSQETMMKPGENRISLSLNYKIEITLTAAFNDEVLEDSGSVTISENRRNITFTAHISEPVSGVTYSWYVNDNLINDTTEQTYTLDCLSDGSIRIGEINAVRCSISRNDETLSSSKQFLFTPKIITPVILYNKITDYAGSVTDSRLGYSTSENMQEYTPLIDGTDGTSLVDFCIGASGMLLTAENAGGTSITEYTVHLRKWNGSSFDDSSITINTMDNEEQNGFAVQEIETDAANNAVYVRGGSDIYYVRPDNTLEQMQLSFSNDVLVLAIRTFCVYDNVLYAVCDTDNDSGSVCIYKTALRAQEEGSVIIDDILQYLTISPDNLEYTDLYACQDSSSDDMHLYLLVRDVNAYCSPDSPLRSRGAVCDINVDRPNESKTVGYADHIVSSNDVSSNTPFSYEHNNMFYGPIKIIAIKEKERKIIIADDGFKIHNGIPATEDDSSNAVPGSGLENVNRIITYDLDSDCIEMNDSSYPEIDFENHYTTFAFSF